MNLPIGQFVCLCWHLIYLAIVDFVHNSGLPPTRQPDVVGPRVGLAAEAHYQLSQGAGGEHGERVARAV